MNIFKNVDWKKGIKNLSSESVDFICIDPPYGKIQGMKLSGQTKNIDWDININWSEMFTIFNRVLKPGGTIAVFGQQPSYSNMIISNLKQFKYEYIWIKNNAAQGFHSNKMPLNFSENIAIFIKHGKNRTFNKPNAIQEINKKEHFTRWYSQKIFNYIGLSRREIHKKLGHRKTEFFFYYTGKNFAIPSKEVYTQITKTFNLKKMNNFLMYSDFKNAWNKEKNLTKGLKLDSKKYKGTFSNVLFFPKDNRPYLHPTQKPLALMKELIKVHSNEGDVVMDCFAGSGSTLVAAKILNRKYIGFEFDKIFYKKAKDRIKITKV